MTHEHYLITTCFLYKIQTCLRNGVQHVLGKGGMDDNGGYLMNAVQILNGVSHIQNCQETEELKNLWTFVEQEEFVKTKFKTQ